MNHSLRFIAHCAALIAVMLSSSCVRAQDGSFDSPRLAALAKDIKAGNKNALTAFWEEMKDKAPLIEPVTDNDKEMWVSYVWRGDEKTERVGIVGGRPSSSELIKPLARFGTTDLWYLTERLPKDARFTYTFMHNYVKLVMGDKEMKQKLAKQSRRDPLNPRSFLFPPNANIAELPAAPPQPWGKQNSDAPRGTLKAEKFKSAILNEDRAIQIYTPPNYETKAKPYSLLIYLDGETVPLMVPLPTILDNLIAGKKIPPTIAVTITSGKTRTRDLACSTNFADFIAKELVPALRSRYAITNDPQQTVISGFSLGGLSASWIAMRHPQVIGNVLSQSGSYWFYEGWNETSSESPFVETGWLTRQYANAPRLPLRFYLEVGTLEQGMPVNMVLENRRMRDTLQARGYPVTYAEYNGGHDLICWRGSIADGLMALLGAPSSGR